MSLNPVALLPYQQAWLRDPSPIKLSLKSRRIGLTWATASIDVINAAAGVDNAIYLSSSQDLADEYMLACREWCYNLGIAPDGEESEDARILDPAIEKSGMQVTKLTFASGKRIIAAPSTPRALRGRQGVITMDECQIMQDFSNVLRAALPMLIWGSKLRLIGTADVPENPFMRLVADIKAGREKEYSYHQIDFDQALEQGLYKRICRKTGKPWSKEREAEWRESIIRKHGIFADAELFCRPLDLQGAGWFRRSKLKFVNSIRDIAFQAPEVRRVVRGYDLAATEPSAKNPDPDHTCGVRVLELSDGNFLIDDVVRMRGAPGAVEQLILDTAHSDGREVEIAIFGDPGAAGAADTAAKARLLTGFVFHAPKATKNKVQFATPVASLVEQGRLYVLQRDWTEDFVTELERFPGASKHDDQVDAMSCAFEILVTRGGYASAWAQAWSRD